MNSSHGTLAIPTQFTFGERLSTHSSPFGSALNSPAITSPNSQCTEAPSICDTKDPKSPPLPPHDTSIPMADTVRTKSSSMTLTHSVEPTYSAIQIMDDEDSVDAPCTPNSAASDHMMRDLNGVNGVNTQHPQHNQHD